MGFPLFYALESVPFLDEVLLEAELTSGDIVACDSHEFVSSPSPGIVINCGLTNPLSFKAWYLTKNTEPVVIDVGVPDSDRYEWEVLVNHQPFTDFSREGSVFTFQANHLGIISILTFHYRERTDG